MQKRFRFVLVSGVLAAVAVAQGSVPTRASTGVKTVSYGSSLEYIIR